MKRPFDDPFSAIDAALKAAPLGGAGDGGDRRHACRGDLGEDGARPLVRRPRQPGGRHPHPCAHRRHPDPRARRRLPDRRGHVRRLRQRDRHGQARADHAVSSPAWPRAASPRPRARRRSAASMSRPRTRTGRARSRRAGPHRRPPRRRRAGLRWAASIRWLMLVLVGAAWGLTLPLLRVAVSTGYQPLGLILWQNVIMAAMLLALLRLMGKPLPLAWRHLGLFTAVAFFGAILPGYFSFLTAADLPAGVRSIIIAIVPMFVLPMALLLGIERPDARARAPGWCWAPRRSSIIAQPGAGVTPAVGRRRAPARADLAVQLRGRGELPRLARVGRAAPVPAAVRGLGGRHRALAGRWPRRPGRCVDSAGLGARRNGRCCFGRAERVGLFRLRLAGRPRGLGVRQPDRLSRHRLRRALVDGCCSASATRGWVWAALRR